MIRRCFILLLLPLVGCSRSPEADAVPGVSDPVDRLSEFRRQHGTDYDPRSRIDRGKMAVISGEATVTERSETARERILSAARPLIGETETHGPNRSPVIDPMNRLTSVPLGSPYCASFNAWVYERAQIPGNWPKSAWSPDWVRSPTWTSAKGGKDPRPGDAFGIWFPSKSRVAHTGLIESWGQTSAVTIEGNTSPSAEFGSTSDRDGDGIWRKRRLRKQIYSVRDWVGK